MDIYFGTAVSPGISCGKAFVIPEQVHRVIPRSAITARDVDSEWLRYTSARDAVSKKIKEQLEKTDSAGDKIQKEIFETYSLMLDDPVFNREVNDSLKERLLNVEYVLNAKVEEHANKLINSGNDYLAERGQDITDIFGRVLNELLDIHPFDMEEIPDGAVLIGRNLSASDALVLSKKHLAALALMEGGPSSHVAILARNYAIPAVFAVPKINRKIKNGDQVIIDADNGEVLICPDETTIQDYRKKIQRQTEEKKALLVFRDKKAQSKDGVQFNIYANVGTVEEARAALENGAEGIGLFRTEFLFMNALNEASEKSIRTMTEESQFEAYKSVLQMFGEKPVTIRTLDAGGDKLLRLLEAPVEDEKNPLMGLRAIRMSLRYPQLFRTQLRALYRASVYGNLRIMLPLITGSAQIQQAREISEQVCGELEVEGVPFKRDVPMGIMVETAAAGIIADILAKDAAFFSVGTNDLTQYTLCVDRENTNVVDLYDEFHPAVMRLLENALNAAEKENIPLSVCGEMASRLDSVLLLAGMGVRNLSMSASQICRVKEKLSTMTVKELKELYDRKRNRP